MFLGFGMGVEAVEEPVNGADFQPFSLLSLHTWGEAPGVTSYKGLKARSISLEATSAEDPDEFGWGLGVYSPLVFGRLREIHTTGAE